jgi:hypothetical protein
MCGRVRSDSKSDGDCGRWQNGPSPGQVMRVLVLLQMLTLTTCAGRQTSEKVKRLPLERSTVVINSPARYAKRVLRYDPKTGEPTSSYDPRPRVEVVDAKSGKYAFKWIGYDGKEKTIEYQRADAIDVIVAASVSKTPEAKYIYVYQVQNQPSSSTYLSHFIVQNFAPDSRPIEVNGRRTNNQDLRILDAFRNAPPDGTSRNLEDLSIGQMSNLIQVFKDGSWIVFAPLPSFEPKVIPGRRFEVKISSMAPPGFVDCRVTGGDLTLKGVGEDMPTELEDMLPGYEEWPRGYTVGPTESLKNLSPSEHAKYILERLPQLEKLGWITKTARRWYEQNLRSDNLNAVFKRAEQDLKSEQITSEVFAMIQAVKR